MSFEPSTIGGDQTVDGLRRELAEAREQQAATAEILRVISSSPMNLQRVFDEMAASAARLCDAYDVVIRQVDGDILRLVAHHGPIATTQMVPLVRGHIQGRAVLDRQTFHVGDLQSQTEYPESSDRARSLGFRTALAVPLIPAGEAIGVIIIRRTEARPFTERQIELLKTFADQAVIAIENTRLFEAEQASKRELQESLEYQTATSEILKVISRSPSDVQPVFDAIAETARRLCQADRATIWTLDRGAFRVATFVGSRHSKFLEERLAQARIEPGRGTVVGRVASERRTIHVHDIQADPEWIGRVPSDDYRRTVLGVPLLSQNDVVGVVILIRGRGVVKPFARNEIALITTFADQAVIAIENARLFAEIALKSRELEIASQHKSQFVANMSHELRTPLAAILGYAELMQEGFYGNQSEKSMDALTRIRSNGKHLLGLINTVLDIAKIESGQFTLNVAEYTIESVVETVRSATESLAQNKKLALKTEVARALPIGLGDEQRLTQVLLNLVGNAIKFTDAGEVRISAGAANGHFAVSVSDTGPGIPAEECERIFEKFRQVDSSNTRAKGGTGLGLAIAREIVAMHGGRIWVESTPGQGSTFRIQLPVRATDTASSA